MSGNPYENEPGFEDAKTEYDKKNQAAYVAKVRTSLDTSTSFAEQVCQIRHETIRISVVDRLEEYLGVSKMGPRAVQAYNADMDYDSNGYEAPFEPFRDLCKRRFMWYYDSYVLAIDEEAKKHEDGTKFEKMPFEGPGNTMEGTFQYTDLKRRLKVVRERLDQETESWAGEGRIAVQKELGIANNLQRQFEQTLEFFKRNDSLPLELELVDKNPFVWQLVLFGRPMTNLDGGLFRIRINISPRFPDEQPRIKFETPLFHQRVSADGVLCYFPQRADDLKSHIEAIVAAVEEESPAYDPRTLVNPEAAKLFWGPGEDRKQYNRKLRRTVQESSE